MGDPKAAEPEDEVLVRRAQAGDQAAVVQLYYRYVNEIYGFGLNQLGNRQDAEDLTSDTFLRFVAALPGFRGRSSLRTWLYAIARNRVRDHWRRNGRHPTVALDPTELALDVAEGALDSAEGAFGPAAEPLPARAQVTRLGQAVFDQLPERYREVLRYRVIDGRSVRDTAEAMHVTEGNVKVLQHRALRRAAEVANQITHEAGDHEHADAGT